jgi:hypothetical protein
MGRNDASKEDNTNIPHLGVRLGAMFASVVALYNTAGLTSSAPLLGRTQEEETVCA